MIVERLARRAVLMSPAGADDGGGGNADSTTITDGDDGAGGAAGDGDDDDAGSEDRGDEVDPAIDADTLNKIAGDDDQPSAGEGADAGGKKGSSHVPIGRFNEVNEEKKRLERENAELRKRAETPAATPAPTPTPAPKPKFDEDTAEKEYAQLLAEGEFDKAVAKRKEINAHIREQARDEAETSVRATLEQRDTAQTLTQVAEKAVKDYPYLDTEAGAEVMDLIIAARDGMHAKGVPLPKALAEAVKKIAPKFAPAATPAQSATPPKDSTGGADGKDTRSQQANARGAADSQKQPPRLDGGTGNRSRGNTVNVEDMTDEQFDALPEAEKRRLRGDDS